MIRDKGEINTFVGIGENETSDTAYKFGEYRAGKTIDFMVNQGIYSKSILDVTGPSFVGKVIGSHFNAQVFGTIGDLDRGTWVADFDECDTILILEVLEHLLNPLWFMEILRHRIKKDANIFLTWPSRPIPTDNHWHEFGLKRFRYLCKLARYEIIRAEYTDIGSTLDWKSRFKGIRPFFRSFVDWHCIAHIKT